jgi:multicomponent Na+:H+ antiporter subunit G
MSSLVIDLIIWALLFAGVGFGLIGLIGLLLFPDTRSRMYTAVRACLISIGATGLAVIVYGLNALQTSGGNQYATLVLHTLVLVLVVAAGNYLVSRSILEKIRVYTGYPAVKENAGTECDKQ